MAAKNVISSTNGKVLFSLIPKARYEEVITFMEKHFFPNETVNRAFNLFTSGSTNAAVRQIVKSELEQDLSYMAIDRETNTLVGAMVSCETNPETKEEKGRLFQQLMTTDRKWHAFMALQQKVFTDNLFQVLGTDRLFEFHLLTLLPGYQGQKLSKPLVRMAHDLGWERGYKAQFSFITAEASKALLTPLQFTVHREVALKDVIFDGKPIIYAENPDVKFRIMIKQQKDQSSN